MSELSNLSNSFAGRVGVHMETSAQGRAVGILLVQPEHINLHNVVHGGVLFTLVDTTMGAALYSLLTPGELCATVDIHMNFLNPVTGGRLSCHSEVVKRGKRMGHMSARVLLGDTVVGSASGNFAIFRPRAEHPATSAGVSA